jgi:predicted TPR repeat methyltransferase
MTETDATIEREASPDEAVEWAHRAMRHRRFDAAEAALAQVLAEFPEHAGALHLTGLLRHLQGETREALGFVERAAALAPQDAGVWNNLGNLRLCVEDSDGAQAAWFRCLELVPDHPSALSNVALLLRHAGHLDEAEKLYGRALEANPNSVVAINNLGTIALVRGDDDAARVLFEKALALEPGFGQAWRNLGEALHRLGRNSEAVTCFWKSISIDQGDRAARKLLVYALYNLGQPDRAKQVAREWLDLDPDDPDARHHYAAVTGENVPARASDAYVERAFDAYASTFDDSLGSLHYRAPEYVADLLGRIAPDLKAAAILDAGCGTGLVAPRVKDRAARLDGIDLSGGMLDKARARGLYDRLDKAEITAAMAERPDTYDVVISADTFCYFGDLFAVVAAAAVALKSGGLLLFTVEALPDGDERTYHLHEGNGRYAHSAAYVDSAVAAAGLDLVAREADVLRSEGLKPVDGWVIASRKP